MKQAGPLQELRSWGAHRLAAVYTYYDTICEKDFHRFFMKNLWAKNEKSMKKKSLVWKTLHCSKRYSQICRIVFETVKNKTLWNQDVWFNTKNPMNSKKASDNFAMEFSFFTHRFFVKNLIIEVEAGLGNKFSIREPHPQPLPSRKGLTSSFS